MSLLLLPPLLLLSYMLGSVPAGLILAVIYADLDLREVGSRNIGATNVLRTTTPRLAGVTLALDMGKGALPTGFAWWLFGDPTLAAVVGVAAVIGHCWSIYLELRGGKGVATATGVLVVLMPHVTLAAALVWIGVFALSKRSSLAALVALVALQLIAWLVLPEALPLTGGLALLLVVRHKENIQRLVRGTEGKIGEQEDPPEGEPS